MTKKPFQLSLRIKLMAVLLGLSIAPIVAVSYFAYLSSESFFRRSASNSLVGLAKVKAQAVENFTQDQVDSVAKIARSPDVVSAVERIANAPAAKESREYDALSKTLGLLRGDGKRYEELFVADLSGAVLVSTVYEHKGRSVSEAEFSEQGAKTTFISTPSVSEITKKLSLVIATPLKSKDGKVIGVFGARLNLSALYGLIQVEKGLGATGETVVGKKIGEEIVFMAPTRHDAEAALKRRVPVEPKESDVDFALREAARGTDGSGFYKDYRGEYALGAWEPIPTLGWGLVVKMDAKEVLSPIIDIRNQIILLAVALIGLAIFLSSWISKGITGPLRQLTEAAESLSRGNMDVKLTIRSQDEVGDLADSFERLLAAVRFLKEEK